jgi:hypothetical protein
VSESVPSSLDSRRKFNQYRLLPHAEHYVAPIGCRWSENSCAYDVIVTPMFVLWCSDRERWSREFRGTNNAIAEMLVDGFGQYEKGETSLEGARDDFRRLIAGLPNGAPFGNYTTIENVCTPLLRSDSVISQMFYQCPNGHHVHYLDDHDALFSTGRNQYESIAQWISLDTSHVDVACQHCGHMVGVQHRFQYTPPLLVFSMPNSATLMNTNLNISVENQSHQYVLTAVVYYGHHHFTCQIITRDGRIWFYDGIAMVDRQVVKYCQILCTLGLFTGNKTYTTAEGIMLAPLSMPVSEGNTSRCEQKKKKVNGLVYATRSGGPHQQVNECDLIDLFKAGVMFSVCAVAASILVHLRR